MVIEVALCKSSSWYLHTLFYPSVFIRVKLDHENVFSSLTAKYNKNHATYYILSINIINITILKFALS